MFGVPGSDQTEIYADKITHTFNGAAQRCGERVRGGLIMRGLTRCGRASREIRTLQRDNKAVGHSIPSAVEFTCYN